MTSFTADQQAQAQRLAGAGMPSQEGDIVIDAIKTLTDRNGGDRIHYDQGRRRHPPKTGRCPVIFAVPA